ncbi:MAG: hypothetical protein A2Y62_04690 [Candidatus Fischerbacteria bacterium RBG_13_37_8]|uniref:Uncharacterized protein n=1 Tax=Candidatus Fischerbacteria bacterium RBG_13_37_8 TaxID=1817863 RepID=A0A1F5VR43_9BACT|nr:MAG: hypothetical protein A2Y62_04690 [Candidatus Fischerbacteria bacterium RBG_13_37_8]
MKRKNGESGYSLVELLAAGFAGLLIILALASAIEAVWIHYLHANHYNRVDNVLAVVSRYLEAGIINGSGGYFWMPVGGANMVYFYSGPGYASIAVEGKEITAEGEWIKVEDPQFFTYALMEGFTGVSIVTNSGLKSAKLLLVDSAGSRIRIAVQGTDPIWVHRGDVIEIQRKLNYLEVREEKLWIEGQGYVAEGVVGFDIMYTSKGKSGYGIVQMPDPADGYIVCNYDANSDGRLTIEDDIDADGNLDCIAHEALEPHKLDGIEYWTLAALPENEARKRNASTETFVVGRKIYTIPRNRYPKIIIKKSNYRDFEL